MKILKIIKMKYNKCSLNNLTKNLTGQQIKYQSYNKRLALYILKEELVQDFYIKILKVI